MPYPYLAQQIQECRRRMDEPAAALISNNHIVSLLNQGGYVSQRDLGIYFQDKYGFSSIASQQEYALPDKFISVSDIIYSPWVNHQPLQESRLDDLLNIFPQIGTDPIAYSIDYANKKVNISPIPQSAAKTTTLNGALNATTTTITVVSTAGFGQQGRIDIDSETISYTGTTATTFTGCVRGVDLTTAATHLTAATVTWQDFIMFYQRNLVEMKTNYATGTIAITTATKVVTGTGTNWLNGQNVYSGNYLGVGSYETTSGAETFPTKWYKILSIDSTTGITLVDTFAEPTVAAGSAYIISDKCELMEAETELPILFALIQMWDKAGNTDRREKASTVYAYEMQEARRRLNGPDYIPRVRKTGEAIDMNYPLPRLPGQFANNQGSV